MNKVGLIGVVLSLLMCSCVPYITMEVTDDLRAEQYSPAQVRPATVEEIQSFLKEDRTDTRMFIPNVYDCKQFSADLWRSAYLNGFEASMVLYQRERSEANRDLAKAFYGVENPFHLVVGFLLTDGDWMYVEPQDDKTLEIAQYKFRLEGAVAFDFWKRLRVFGEDGDEILNEIVEEHEKNSREPSAGSGVAGISFPDQNLEAAIREAVGKATGDIYEADVENLTSLNASERGVVALTGLEHATSLRHLYLDSNNISDISPLANLGNMTDLYLGWNQISDVSSLGKLTSLTHLDLHSNHIGDISVLANLTSLTFLRLDSNQISDISPLTNLSSLTELYLVSNKIGDISRLAKLTSLALLCLDSNNISDISPVANLTNLALLHLDSNQISDISSLAGLTDLTDLYLGRNQISDVSPLVANAGLGEGDKVDLEDNPLSDTSLYTYIPQLQAGGVTVFYDSSAG